MMKITPQAVLLTSGQAATFQTTDDAGKPVDATWTLSPSAVGILDIPGSGNTSSASYVAPNVTSEQTVAVIASGPDGSANATISLTPSAITVLPAEVALKPGQEQRFVAIVAGSSPVPARVTWILSPPIGKLQPDGNRLLETVYTAAEVGDTTKVSLIATSETTGKQATAVMSLTSPPWTGRGVQLLGTYLLLVFTLVFLIVLLWPPALPSPETARADRIQAEKNLEDKTGVLQKSETDLAKAKGKAAAATATGTSAAAGQNAAAANEAQAELDAATLANERARQAEQYAQSDLVKRRADETQVNDPTISTRLGKMNRELDLLWLVLLSGALGSFLHMSQSFSDYIGNATLKSNWAWWYYFRPFIGAGLALVFYAALRGGVMAIASGANATGAQINPFGLVSIGAMVGMFSKAATMKLGEVFDTIFKSKQADASKDKLNTPPAQSAGTTSSGTSTADAASSGKTS